MVIIMPPSKRLIRYECECHDCGGKWHSQFRESPVRRCRYCQRMNFSAVPFDEKRVPWSTPSEE
jgi:peptide methionine sulfoxide reductase MsrB